MASVEIGGYELRFDTGSVFYTENFFSILGIPLIQSDFKRVYRKESL